MIGWHMNVVTRKALALVRSCHPIPCLAVSLFVGLFAVGSGIPIMRGMEIASAVLLQQISVGLSNDWLDQKRDLLAGRTDKPSFGGLVTPAELRFGSLTAAILAEAAAFALGFSAGMLMVLMLAIGWAYNLGMKSNWSSAIPYALGFGTLPVFAGLAAETPFWPPVWLVSVAALLGVSAHFANALPDMMDDKLTGVNALPHILGQRVSAVVIAVTAMLATVLVVTLSKALEPLVAVIGLVATALLVGFASGLSLKTNPPRVVFYLLVAASLVNVVLLVLGSGR